MAIIVVVSYVPFARWWYVLHNRRVNRTAANTSLGFKRLFLENRQLTLQGLETTTTLKPSAIQRVEESVTHYFIYIGPMQAIVVPKYSEQVSSFMEALLEFRAAA